MRFGKEQDADHWLSPADPELLDHSQLLDDSHQLTYGLGVRGLLEGSRCRGSKWGLHDDQRIV